MRIASADMRLVRGIVEWAAGVVEDLAHLDAALNQVVADRVDVSEVSGPDPEKGRSYLTTASFSDPDGNGWLLQEITTRLPGREWED